MRGVVPMIVVLEEKQGEAATRTTDLDENPVSMIVDDDGTIPENPVRGTMTTTMIVDDGTTTMEDVVVRISEIMSGPVVIIVETNEERRITTWKTLAAALDETGNRQEMTITMTKTRNDEVDSGDNE
jgi:hypothetical protein